MRRQQQVLKAILQQARQPELIRLPLLARELVQHVRTDLTLTQIYALARLATDLEQEQNCRRKAARQSSLN